MLSHLATPQVFLAYAPRGEGLRCALAYLANGNDVYGWYTGPNGPDSLASLYFVLEDYHSKHEPRYAAAEALDLHAGWLLDGKRCHELAELQEAFVAEWLFYRSDPRAAKEVEAYDRAQLALGEVNVRFEKLNKFSRLQPNWTHYSPGFEHGVLRVLGKRWPLQCRSEDL